MEEAERELLGYIYIKPTIIDQLQITPDMFSNKQYGEILKAYINSYKETGELSFASIYDYNSKIDLALIDELYQESLNVGDVDKKAKNDEAYILSNYKKTFVNNMIEKFNDGEMSFDELANKVTEAQLYSINNNGSKLTTNELTEGIKSTLAIELKDFPILNKTLRLHRTDFLVIGAKTGTGKSSFLLNLMQTLSKEYQCVYFNMEMSKSTIYQRILAIDSGVPVFDIEEPKSAYQKELIQKSIKEIEARGIIVEHLKTDINDIKRIILSSKQSGNGKHTIVFLDHIGLITMKGTKNEYEEQTKIAKELRRISMAYDCTIIAASQFNRSSYQAEQLSVSMLKSSGEIEQSASRVILLYKDEEDTTDDLHPVMYVEIGKSRDGIDSRIKFNYDKTKQIFRERGIQNGK